MEEGFSLLESLSYAFGNSICIYSVQEHIGQVLTCHLYELSPSNLVKLQYSTAQYTVYSTVLYCTICQLNSYTGTRTLTKGGRLRTVQ